MQENKKIVIDGVQWIVQDKNETSIVLKTENKECLSCIECVENICQSMTCEYYNMSILDFKEDRCIHKIKRTLEYYEDKQTESLF